ncbi:metal-dependent hydrolase [Halorhabdus amylolytica]|uniref:metal-dependent hydrolase n=1 Tax=Halorhabdus amylolytica TaxID=2559573 RepID=UPI0010A9EA36|nr:metal-dependent hydrolase [Halorhabdus amylolytica]
MMLPTHVLAGMALAIPVSFVAPEFAGVGLLAGLLGGMFPDLDMYVGHRKTLHYPVYYSVFAVPSLVVAVFLPSIWTVFPAVFLAGAAVHSLADVFGGGLELRPWEGTSDRAVYDHYRERWISPRQWISHDGSPGDLLLSYALAFPLLLAVEGTFHWAVIAALAVGSVYAAVRRQLPTLAAVVLDVAGPWLPEDVLSTIPTRYRDGHPDPAGSGASD